MEKINKWLYGQRGQGTVEYLLVVGVIVVAVVGTGFAFRDQIQEVIKSVMTAIQGTFG